ncbi:hypothetical protein PIB30_016886 [Stylosanthes scabra]|uniref:Uncharacterized protein n=1 Tax=Stylosanthes scabra TaxID=79078 RepID=A0ABU6V6I5_9FABA|nr:hypothetical protein [Stylosanthes scabra]
MVPPSSSLSPYLDYRELFIRIITGQFILYQWIRLCVTHLGRWSGIYVEAWKRLAPLTRPLGAGTFVRCSLESPLSLADGVWNVLKRGVTGCNQNTEYGTRVVLLRKRKGKSVFDWGWL